MASERLLRSSCTLGMFASFLRSFGNSVVPLYFLIFSSVTTIVSSTIELAMKIAAALWLIPTLGFLGTCITEPIIWVLCAVFLSAVYFRKKGGLYGRETV